MMREGTALALLSILLLTSACIPVEINVNLVPETAQKQESETLTPVPVPGTITSPSATPFMPAITTPEIPSTQGGPDDQQRAVDAARRHLAAVLGIPFEHITLLKVEPATWRDAGLGCARAGRNYAQVITPGYRILLEHAGQRYELHSDQSGGTVVMCMQTLPGARIPLGRGLSQEGIVEAAHEHLASRLDIALDSVIMVSVEAAEWDDPGLGCDYPPGKQPDRAYPRGVPGLRILLEADGRTYEYHSGGLWLVFCGEQGSSSLD